MRSKVQGWPLRNRSGDDLNSFAASARFFSTQRLPSASRLSASGAFARMDVSSVTLPSTNRVLTVKSGFGSAAMACAEAIEKAAVSTIEINFMVAV